MGTKRAEAFKKPAGKNGPEVKKQSCAKKKTEEEFAKAILANALGSLISAAASHYLPALMDAIQSQLTILLNFRNAGCPKDLNFKEEHYRFLRLQEAYATLTTENRLTIKLSGIDSGIHAKAMPMWDDLLKSKTWTEDGRLLASLEAFIEAQGLRTKISSLPDS